MAIGAVQDKTTKFTGITEDTTLTVADAQRLVAICAELVSLTSRVTRKIDPAVGTLIAYARDEIITAARESKP